MSAMGSMLMPQGACIFACLHDHELGRGAEDPCLLVCAGGHLFVCLSVCLSIRHTKLYTYTNYTHHQVQATKNTHTLFKKDGLSISQVPVIHT